MKAFLFGGLLVLLGLSCARAELPMPTCEMIKRGYDELTSRPYSAEDDSLSRVATVFADNQLFAKDANRTALATKEDLIDHVHKFSPLDQVLWMHKQYLVLQEWMQNNKCPFEKRDLQMRNPTPVTPTCKGGPPDLSKPLGK